jgi:hypothetical protein
VCGGCVPVVVRHRNGATARGRGVIVGRGVRCIVRAKMRRMMMSIVRAPLSRCDLCQLLFPGDVLSAPLDCGHRYCPGCERDYYADAPCIMCRQEREWD